VRSAAASKAKVKALADRGVELLLLRGNGRGEISPALILRALGRLAIASVLVEGGGNVFGGFLSAGVVDKCYWFIAPRTLGAWRENSHRPSIEAKVALTRISHWNIDGDTLIEGYLDHKRNA
jgi:riboflavin biosynthesis pyrimidine reductase